MKTNPINSGQVYYLYLDGIEVFIKHPLVSVQYNSVSTLLVPSPAYLVEMDALHALSIQSCTGLIKASEKPCLELNLWMKRKAGDHQRRVSI